MPEFILDTSGTVYVPGTLGMPAPGFETAYKWRLLDAFTQGYIEALFFTESEPQTTREDAFTARGTIRKTWRRAVEEGQQKDIPEDFGFADLAPDSLAKIIEDCRAFQEANRADLEEACGMPSGRRGEPYDMTRAGHDFWFTRNGHGVGFWDRDLGDVGEKLSAACGWRTTFGEVSVYLGEDGKVYVS